MKLSFKETESITFGVDRCEETADSFVFHRFSKEQEEIYKRDAPLLYNKTFASSGVSLRFITNSITLKLTVDTTVGSSRTYFSHDVFVNEKYIDSLRNFTDDVNNGTYPVTAYSLGRFSKVFMLGEGEKEVTVLFPALVSSAVKSIELDDNASLIPAAPKGEYLAIGDSISQGYDSLYPKNRYTNIISENFGLFEHNLAIGGEVYRPELAQTIKDSKSIKLVTVAYGSNDWFHKPYEEAKANCEGFLGTVSENFKSKKIYVISPIWRSDMNEERPFGNFIDMGKMIEKICGKYDNLVFIDGFDFVPHDTSLFGDGSLHPNSNGFSYYAESLFNAIKEKEKMSR